MAGSSSSSEAPEVGSSPAPDDVALRSWPPWPPTALSVLLLVCLLVPFTLVTSGGGGEFQIGMDGTDPGSTTWRRWGPGFFTRTSVEAFGKTVHEDSIGWIQIAVSLAIGYVLAWWVARRVQELIGRGAARLVFVWIPLALLAFAVLAGGGCSKAYWGYWFSRPASLATEDFVVRPTHWSFVNMDTARSPFTTHPERSLNETLEETERDPYYGLDGRVVGGFAQRDTALDGLPPVPQPDLERLLSTIQSGALLVTPDAGYAARANRLSGVVVLGLGPNDEPRLLTALKGGEVSNDHRPYYEFAFEWPAAGSPALLDRQLFFYDVAGLEGLEWTSITFGLATLGTIVLLIVAFVIALLPRRVPGSPQPPLESSN